VFGLWIAAALVAACAEVRVCYDGEFGACDCDDGARGYQPCGGETYGQCICDGTTPGLVTASVGGSGGAGGAGGAGGPTLLGFMEECTTDEDCESGNCFFYPGKGVSLCTLSCTTATDCPPPSPGCNGMGVCKAP
jgi:hypothetical protein